MKIPFPRLSPASRIAIGLVSLTVTLLLIIDIALKLVPDPTEMHRKIRESTSERLAVQVTSLVQAQEWDTLKTTLREAVERDEEILSLSLRQINGDVLIRAGDHLRYWKPPAAGKSTLTHVRVPVYAANAHWGDVEISYAPVTPQTLREWLRTPLLALSLVIVPSGFLAFYLYLRRSLQYLDPSAAVPERVQVAFDALTEGVTVIDLNGRIMLYNRAFKQLHPLAADDMIGKKLSQLHWLKECLTSAAAPWDHPMQRQASSGGRLISITHPDETAVKVIVNTSPIEDAAGKLRGSIVTFYDVTQLHAANEKMRLALEALEASREQIEKKNEELMSLASRDSLTGCLNRRAFFSTAEPLFAKLRQEARNLSCIMVDIDFFKKVNDSYGHHTGDQVIVAVARSLSLHMRADDLLCRYGGEEFCILLPGTSEDIAIEVAERLRADIERNTGAGVRTVSGLHVTSSLGVATLKSGAENLGELIELADFALYISKRTGRNRVTLWRPDLAQKAAES